MNNSVVLVRWSGWLEMEGGTGGINGDGKKCSKIELLKIFVCCEGVHQFLEIIMCL